MTIHPAYALAAFLVATPAAVQAQGLVRGAERGADQGERAAGPIGAIVGGAAGAAMGTVGGILGLDQRPRFHDYVEKRHHPSSRYAHDPRNGDILPEQGVEYYQVPAEYKVSPDLRYTVVNTHPVLVDPQTRRIVEILD